MDGSGDGAPWWERPLPGESHTAFMAFCCYRDQGLARSLKSASETFYADRQHPDGGPQTDPEGTPGSGALRRFKRWSSEFSWVSRAEGYDAEEAARRSLVMQERRLKMVETHYQLARNGQAVIADRFREYARGEARLPNNVLPSFLTAVTNLERITLGEATARTEQVQKPVERQPDFSVLSDEEVDQLYELGRKLGEIED